MVKEDKELWMKKMRESLKDYSEPLPQDGWQRLDNTLPSSKTAPKISIYGWMSVAAVIALFITAVTFLFITNDLDEKVMQLPAPIARIENEDDKTESESLANTSSQVIKKQNIEAFIRANIDSDPKTFQPEEEVTEFKNKNEVAADTKEERINETEVEASAGTSVETKKVERKPSTRDKLHIPSAENKKHKKWGMGVHIGNAAGASGNTEDAFMYSSYDRLSLSDVANSFITIPSNQSISFKEGVPYLVSEISDVNHHQPISFGLSLRKELTSNLSLETGLTYTLLSSDIKFVGGSQELEQKIHYLGIPLKLNWNFANSKRFTFYVTGGGMIEKAVYGKLGDEDITVKPLQLSISSALGGQLNINKNIGLYLEPGVAYFFDDGSEIETIRKETPFNFNLQAGVRFTY